MKGLMKSLLIVGIILCSLLSLKIITDLLLTKMKKYYVVSNSEESAF